MNIIKFKTSLKESILNDIDSIIDSGDNAIKKIIEKSFNCFDIDITKNAIILTYNENNNNIHGVCKEPSILKNVPGKEKIIVKDSNLLYIRSGVTSDTIKRLESKQPLLLIFRNYWFDKKPVEYSELKNCTLEVDMIEFAYPVVFKNCTIKLNSKFINFKDFDSLKTINDLKGLKLESMNYNSVILNIINTKLGNDIFDNKNDDKYMNRIYKVFASVFSEMIKKNQQFKIRIHRDWYIEYSSISDFWHCAYGY